MSGQRYSLTIHCGVRYALFDGLAWEAVAPVPTFPGYVTDPKTGVATSRSAIEGTLVRTSDTEATFTTTDPPAGLTVRFVNTSASPGLCA